MTSFQGLGFYFQILLYQKGVNIDAQDNNGMTPLILASKDCAVTMTKQLLDRQAEPGIADNKGNNNRLDRNHSLL